jgi:HEAT repeat protein
MAIEPTSVGERALMRPSWPTLLLAVGLGAVAIMIVWLLIEVKGQQAILQSQEKVLQANRDSQLQAQKDSQRALAEELARIRSDLKSLRGEQAAASAPLNVELRQVREMLTKHDQQAEKESSYKGKAVGAWMNVLQDLDPDTRRDAATAMRMFGPKAKDAAKPLLGLLQDPDVGVRRQALQALGAIRVQDSEATIPLRIASYDPDQEVRREATLALQRLAQALVPDCLRLLAAFEAEPAIERLGAIGRPAVPHLVKALKNTNPRVRAHAAQALGFIGREAKDAVPLLQEARQDKDQSVRLAASVALAWITKDTVAPADKAANEWKKRFGLKRVLTNSANEPRDAIELLIAGMKDTDKTFAYLVAVEALQFGGFRELNPDEKKVVVPALVQLLKDEDSNIRQATEQSLRKIDPEALKKVMGP